MPGVQLSNVITSFFAFCIIVRVSHGVSICDTVGGVMDGGRCFFVSSSASSWDSAFSACQAQAASLAQIQTDLEYGKVRSMILTKFAPTTTIAVNVALRRNSPISGNPCAVTNDSTYWYNSNGAPNFALNAGRTWVRYRTCGDYDTGGEYCMHMRVWTTQLPPLFNDVPCGGNYGVRSLCQINVCSQTHNLTSFCMVEEPIETLPATRPEDCGDACGQRPWCRSFNYVRNLNDCNMFSCELFTWSVYDTVGPKTIPAPANQSCVHYNYVP